MVMPRPGVAAVDVGVMHAQAHGMRSPSCEAAASIGCDGGRTTLLTTQSARPIPGGCA